MKNSLSNIEMMIDALVAHKVKNVCSDVNEYGLTTRIFSLTALTGANSIAFDCGHKELFEPGVSRKYAVHVRSYEDVCLMNQEHSRALYDIFFGKSKSPELSYLDYLNSNDGRDTILMMLTEREEEPLLKKENNNSDDFATKPSASVVSKLSAADEASKREKEYNDLATSRIIAAVEMTKSVYGNYELNMDTNEIVFDYKEFRNRFNNAMHNGYATTEKSAFKTVEEMSISCRTSAINDVISLFKMYAHSHLDDSYFFKSLTKELPRYMVYASDEDYERGDALNQRVLNLIKENNNDIQYYTI